MPDSFDQANTLFSEMTGQDFDESHTMHRTLVNPLTQGMTNPGFTLPPIRTFARDEIPAELRLSERLGSGGMADIFLGQQASLHREVAVKILKDQGRAEAAWDLVREARIMGGLEHPNIVPVHTLGEDSEGRPILVMKRVEGREWLSLLKEEKYDDQGLPSDRLVRHLEIFSKVCDALSFAHANGVVHRDLKPANVMIGAFGEVYVLDWGIAVNLTVPEDSEAMGVCGTPVYMAPEMLTGEIGDITPQTDIYQLGAILHRLVMGKPRHPTTSPFGLLDSIANSRPFDYPAQVAEELAGICNKATSVEPSDRHVNVVELKTAITDYLSHRHSRSLGEAADSKLRMIDGMVKRLDMSTDSSQLRIYRMLGECRFGFKQAMELWPENPSAKDGFVRSVAMLIDFELKRGNVTSAVLLLRGMPDPDEALVARVEAAEAEEEKRRLRLDNLEKLAWDMDPDVEKGVRLALVVVFGVLTTCGPLLDAYLVRQGSVPASGAYHLVSPFAAFSLVLSGMFLFRQRLLTNSAMRQNASLIALTLLSMAFYRIRCTVLGVSFIEMLGFEQLFFVVGVGAIVLISDPRIVWAIPIWLASSMAIAFWSDMGPEIFALGNGLAMVALLLGWWKGKPPAPGGLIGRYARSLDSAEG